MLCAINEINDLLIAFCYVFSNNTITKKEYNHSNLCHHCLNCPKFRKVQKKNYFGLNFEKKYLSF